MKALIWQERTDTGVPVWLRITAPEELEPSPNGSSALLDDIAMILSAIIDPNDALAAAPP